MASFDSQKPIEMKNYTGFDSFIARTIKDRKNKDNWTPSLYETQHLWKIQIPKELKKGMHKIEVNAFTDKGKIYKGYKIFEIH
jgi:hypothetical protein